MLAENTKTFSIEEIQGAFEMLYPDEFEFLTLYNLYINYHSQEFQYAEIKQAIVDTSRLPFMLNGKDVQVERKFKRLLRAFIERIPSKSNRFVLTPHAEKIIEIAVQRINNPYLKYPLKDTFEQFFRLPDDLSDDISRLQSWFQFGFHNNARQMVLGHLEALKLSVDDSVKALNSVLEIEDKSAIQLLEEFAENFKVLGDKARQITEAIRMKVHVHYRLRDIAEVFSLKSLDSLPGEEYLLYCRKEALRIKDEVSSFFDKIDQQLDLINQKMTFAASKISELQESLRAQSHFKFNLKKLLIYLLENSKPNLQSWELPAGFPAKDMVTQKFRFSALRYYDMGFLKKANVVVQETDELYEEEQRLQFEMELKKQELIQQYCDQAESDLALYGTLDLTTRIMDIMQEENGLELAVHTGYEFIRKVSPFANVEITETLQSNQSNTFQLWKVTVRKDRHSNS
ncbi:hypothetical protein AB6805_14790 [Chitinophaga sp. RCC_12]|uniref:hypothetical protein n=1 Tax=Chitinophaga sp. RCC_12 TaxID=3239226 RepID=UPI0035264CF2